MKDLDLKWTLEDHVNPIVESYIRSHKLDKVEEIFQLLEFE